MVILATRVAAAPTPSPSPSPSSNGNCSLIVGPAKDYCEGGNSAPKSNLPDSVDPAQDPLTSLGRGCADAAAWIVGKLSEAV
ncbi:hypothetical protein JGS39_39530, partial [Streptomyces sp. P01-B04]|nr:hypothetical protein [Streptomyces poriferorum]